MMCRLTYRDSGERSSKYGKHMMQLPFAAQIRKRCSVPSCCQFKQTVQASEPAAVGIGRRCQLQEMVLQAHEMLND